MQDSEKTYQTALVLEKIVLADAESRAAQIVAEAKAAEKAAVRDAKRKARTEAQRFESESTAAIRARSQNAISDYEADCKKRLIDERSRIQREVEKRLCERLCEYSDTAEYEKALNAKLDALALPRTCTAVYRGKAAEAAVKARFSDAKEAEDIRLGGCVITNAESGVVYDLTLDAGFEDAVARFPEISGLEITER